MLIKILWIPVSDREHQENALLPDRPLSRSHLCVIPSVTNCFLFSQLINSHAHEIQKLTRNAFRWIVSFECVKMRGLEISQSFWRESQTAICSKPTPPDQQGEGGVRGREMVSNTSNLSHYAMLRSLASNTPPAPSHAVWTRLNV